MPPRPARASVRRDRRFPLHFLIVGGTPDDRRRHAQALAPPASTVSLDARVLPFTRIEQIALPMPPRVVLLDNIERAFPAYQAGSTRLVLTQSTYLLQKWIDRLDPQDVVIATGDAATLERVAPEAFQRRGPWREFQVERLGNSPGHFTTEDTKNPKDETERPKDHGFVSLVSSVVIGIPSQLAAAYEVGDGAARLHLCRDAVERAPDDAVAHLALASALRENRDVAARNSLERAAALAPEWEAVHYELGKL